MQLIPKCHVYWGIIVLTSKIDLASLWMMLTYDACAVVSLLSPNLRVKSHEILRSNPNFSCWNPYLLVLEIQFCFIVNSIDPPNDTLVLTLRSCLSHLHKAVPHSWLSWFITPITMVISTINHSYMGIICTNLANELGHHLAGPFPPDWLLMMACYAAHSAASPEMAWFWWKEGYTGEKPSMAVINGD